MDKNTCTALLRHYQQVESKEKKEGHPHDFDYLPI